MSYNYFNSQEDLEFFGKALVLSGLVKQGMKRMIFCTELKYDLPSQEVDLSDDDFAKVLATNLDAGLRRKPLIQCGERAFEVCKDKEIDIDLNKLKKIYSNLKQQAIEPESIPKGWDYLDKLTLEKARLEDEDDVKDGLINFFNGAPPRWSEIVTEKIHERKKVEELVDTIEKHRNNMSPHIHLLLDAGGEGKSTIMMQTIYRLLQNPNQPVHVLCRNEFETGNLSQEFFQKRPKSGENWLIVADEATDIGEHIIGLSQWLYANNYQGYQFLLVSRDTDWYTPRDNVRGVVIKTFTAGGLDKADARGIAASWYAYKQRGMGALHGKDIDEGAAALLKKAHEGAGHIEGSLFGAIFDLRIEGQLDAHIYEMISRLERDKKGQERVVHGTQLLDIYAYIIALHAEGFNYLNQAILARVLGIPSPKHQFTPRNETITREIYPLLGREAAIAPHKHYVLSRHRTIAKAAKRYLVSKGFDFSKRVLELVRTAREMYHEAKSLGVEEKFFPDIPEEDSSEVWEWSFGLADNFSKSNPELAISIMKEIWRVEKYQDPRILRKLTSLLRTYGGDEGVERARKIFYLAKKADIGRAFYHEWSTTEGFANNLYWAICIGALALADEVKDELDNYRIKVVLTNLMEIFLKLPLDPVYQSAARACTALAQSFDLHEDKDKRLISEYKKALKEGYKAPKSNYQLIQAVIDGIKKADQQKSEAPSDWNKALAELRLKVEASEGLLENPEARARHSSGTSDKRETVLDWIRPISKLSFDELEEFFENLNN